ncbi:MAG: hypothetical protein ACYCXY_10060 [Acidimicrobiales bacterium]
MDVTAATRTFVSARTRSPSCTSHLGGAASPSHSVHLVHRHAQGSILVKAARLRDAVQQLLQLGPHRLSSTTPQVRTKGVFDDGALGPLRRQRGSLRRREDVGIEVDGRLLLRQAYMIPIMTS